MESARYTNLPFFWLLTRNQDFFDKKCRILTFRDKKCHILTYMWHKADLCFGENRMGVKFQLDLLSKTWPPDGAAE